MRVERIGDATLYLGDCRDILPTLGKVDAVVTDPPYGIKQDKGFDGFGGFGAPIARRQYAGEWDSERPAAELLHLCVAAGERAIVWGGQYFADVLPAQGRWLGWDKCQTMPTFGDGELAWTNLPGVAPKKFVYSNNGLMAKEKNREHPTQKPVQLLMWCLGFLPDARTILDPFMGSGTTGVACAKLGRSFIGIELEPKYFDIACRRIDEAYRQPRLFVDAPVKPKQEAMAV
jgi:DNA modification methylase